MPPSDMTFSVVSPSRYQLLETARVLKHMHGLDIVHGNFDVVRPPRVAVLIMRLLKLSSRLMSS